MNLKLVKACSIIEEVTEGSLEQEINPSKRVESIWRPNSSIEVDPRVVPMIFVNRRIFSINSVVSHCSQKLFCGSSSQRMFWSCHFEGKDFLVTGNGRDGFFIRPTSRLPFIVST
jgi:hypothetical protein